MRRKIVLTSINGVAPGQTATLDLPTGRRYFGLYVRYKTNANQATIEADITEIRVIVNGKVQRRLTAADNNILLATKGQAFRAGLIFIPFAVARAREWVGEEGLAWGTRGVSTFRVEFDISGAAVAPTLTAKADVDDVDAPLGPIVKIYKETFTATGAQTLNITTLPKRDSYLGITARSALATGMKVTVDGLEVWEGNLADSQDFIAPRNMVQQANNFSLVFNDSDQVTDGLPMARQSANGLVPVQEFRLDLTASGAGQIPLLIERVGSPD